jgi:hypothetical protein
MISNAISTGVKIKIWDNPSIPYTSNNPKINKFKGLNPPTPEEKQNPFPSPPIQTSRTPPPPPLQEKNLK